MSCLMGLQSKALTCENCQFSGRGVSTLTKQKLLEHFGTVHVGFPVQHLSSFPFLTATGLSKIKGHKEQLFRCRTSGVCHFIGRPVCCKVRLCLVAGKLLTYPLPGYGALGWTWRHLFLPEVCFGKTQWRLEQFWEVSSPPWALANFASHKCTKKSPSLGKRVWLGFFLQRL